MARPDRFRRLSSPPRRAPARGRRVRGSWVRGGWVRALAELCPLALMLALAPPAAFAASRMWHAPHAATPAPGTGDGESARFDACRGERRISCVVDGDTFWYRAQKIRIADINTPEVSEPHCAREARLGNRATARLTQLLNAGPFSLQPIDRQTDRYGRRLLIVTRGGESLGETLVREGLAERWRGHRGNWCKGP